MNRTVKYVLPATLFVLACLVGMSWAQQGSTNAGLAKEQGKAEEADKSPSRVNRFLEAYNKKYAKQLDDLKSQKVKLQSEQKQLRDEIYKRCDMSPENVVPSLLNIEREILTAQIDLRAKEGGNQVFANQISETTEKSKINLDNDQVLKELKTLVNDKTDACKILEGMQKSGTAPYIDLNKAKAELSEAKIRLALCEEDLTKGDGDAGTAKLNLLMRENSLAIAQIEVRLGALVNQCHKLRDTRDLVDHYNDITESEIPRFNRLIDRLSEQIQDEKE